MGSNIWIVRYWSVTAISIYILGPDNAEQLYHREEQVADCVTTISDRYFASNHTLVYSISNRARSFSASLQNISASGDFAESWVEVLLESMHLMGRWPILVSCPTGELMKHDDTKNDDKHGSYVLSTAYLCRGRNEALLDVKEQIQRLETYYAWNPRCRFVVILVEQGNDCDTKVTVEELLKELREWKITNTLILVKKNSDIIDSLDIYSWSPYQPPSGVCGQMMEKVLLDTCVSNDTSGFLRRNTPLFQEKIPNKLSGCSLRVQVAHLPPYVIFQKNDNSFEDVPSFIGLDIDMIRTIAEVMNMSLELIPLHDTYPWGKMINGTWFGLKGGLMYDIADIALDAWSMNLEDYLQFQGTERYFTDDITWYVPRAKPKARWMSVARVFARNTWFMYFLSIFVSATVFWSLAVTRSKFEDSHKYRNIFNCFADSWAVVLGVTVPEIPYNASLRLFFISWVIYSLSMSNIFQTFFISYLIDPGQEHGVNNVDELVDSELDIILSLFLSSFFDEKFLKNPNRRTIVDSPYECLQNLANKSNVATMLSRAYFTSAGNEFLDRDKQLNFSPFNEDVYSSHIFMVLKRGSCLLDRINEVIFRLVEAGLPDKFLSDILDTKRQYSISRTMEDLNEEYVSMTVSHLQSAFVLLCLGNLLSVITFIMEILHKRWEERREHSAHIKKRKATEEYK